MEIDKKRFSLAAALTVSIISAFCALVVFLIPDIAVKLFGWLVHLVNLEPAEITLAGAIIGIIQAFVYTYIGAWIFVWLHNRSIKRS